MPLQNCTKCSALIPDDLLDKLKEAGYENRAEAIRLGLECLIRESQKNLKDSRENQERILANTEESYKNLSESYKTLEESYENQKESSATLRESIAGLQARNEELKAHNETLKKDLENANKREEDLKNMHNNYMLQMQTLINQRALESPEEKKRPWYKIW